MSLSRRARWASALTTILVAAGLLLALRGGDEPAGDLPEAGSQFGASAVSTPQRGGRRRVDALAPTPLGRSVAKLFLIGFPGADPNPEVRRHLTAREWGGVVLDGANRGTDAVLTRLGRDIRQAATAAGHDPPIIAAVQPGPGPLADAAAARAQAHAAGRQLRAIGIGMALAPLADLGSTGGPWAGAAYSDDPREVADLSAAAVAGWRAADVAAAPGHFPGEGAASADPVRGASTVGLSLEELRRGDLRPFAAFARHAPAIQLSAAAYAAFDGVSPATILPETVRLLREELGFRGVIVSGNLAAASLGSGTAVADLAVAALKAGCDLLWIPGDASDQHAAWRAVISAVRRGDVPRDRLAEAGRRVSVLRAGYGLR